MSLRDHEVIKLEEYAAEADIGGWFDYQLEAFDNLLEDVVKQGMRVRRCLYYKTGAGKSITALTMVKLAGWLDVMVITPPSTFPQWEELAAKMGMFITCMSHAKFRDRNTKLDRDTAVIADEMHLFGRNTGQGWKKLDRLAAGLKAPLILASATPNYNDAERVYCIQHILDPDSCKGGFLQFLYDHCVTEQNPYSLTPNVAGFKNYPDAAAYLADLPGVDYLPDDLVFAIQDHDVPNHWPAWADRFGYHDRKRRIIASQIEERHARVEKALVDPSGRLRSSVRQLLTWLVDAATTPSLVFAAHSTIAEITARALNEHQIPTAVVTGSTTKKRKAEILEEFKAGKHKVLVGTATLATGTDGLDKVCDQLIILDDTDDDSLRRQLIGRIMPRGASTNVGVKSVHRIVRA